MSIVLKIVYPNLEAAGGEFLPQFGWNPVTAFRDKIKGRAESKILFQLHQGPAPPSPALLSTSCVRINANFLPSGQPGQFSGEISDPGIIGQTSPIRLRSRVASFRRIAVRSDWGIKGFSP